VGDSSSSSSSGGGGGGPILLSGEHDASDAVTLSVGVAVINRDVAGDCSDVVCTTPL